MNVKTSSEKMREHLRSALDIAIAQEEKSYRGVLETLDDRSKQAMVLMNPIYEALNLLKEELAENEGIIISPNAAIIFFKTHGIIRKTIEISVNLTRTGYTFSQTDKPMFHDETMECEDDVPTKEEALRRIVRAIAQHVAQDNVHQERKNKNNENTKAEILTMEQITAVLRLLKQKFFNSEEIIIIPKEAVINLKRLGKLAKIIKIKLNETHTGYVFYETDKLSGDSRAMSCTVEVPTEVEVFSRITTAINKHLGIE